MGKIENLLANVRRFNEGLKNGTFIQDIIIENEAFICDMNAQDQLFEHGENALGVSISSYAPYAPSTIRRKKWKGQPTDRVTLRDEGDFEGSFFIDADREKFTIRASDWKTELLKYNYGDEIMGLNARNQSVVAREILRPELLTIAKKMIYVKN